MRPRIALLTLVCCFAVASPAAAATSAPPRYQLLGNWSFHGHRYHFVRRGGAIYGTSLASVRVGHCLEKKGTRLFRGYRFSGTRGGVDYWKGKVTVVGGTCRQAHVSSTITQPSDLTFAESSRLPGGRRPPPSSFTRVRPPLSATDPVLGTWVRNGAGVVVTQEGSLYVGRAREAFGIANGCTVPAGSIIWRMRPVAPDRYSGTIQTYFGPPTCAPASFDKSTWVLVPSLGQLARQSAQGAAFPYARG